MDPITLIVTALVAGAAAGGQAVATDAVKGAYAALKGAILRRFGDQPVVSVAVQQAEARPEVWQVPLHDALTNAGAGQDPEIVRLAQELMRLAEPLAAQQGRFNVQIAGDVQGMAVGDHQHVEMTFNPKPNP